MFFFRATTANACLDTQASIVMSTLTIVLLTHVRMVEGVKMALTVTNALVPVVGKANTVRSISTNA